MDCGAEIYLAFLCVFNYYDFVEFKQTHSIQVKIITKMIL